MIKNSFLASLLLCILFLQGSIRANSSTEIADLNKKIAMTNLNQPLHFIKNILDLPGDMLNEIGMHCSAKSLLSLSTSCKKMRGVFEDLTVRKAAGIQFYIRKLGSLECLKRFIIGGAFVFYGQNQINDDVLRKLRGVYSINLSRCFNITDDGLQNLIEAHTINLSNCYNITDAGVKHLSKVHTVNLSGCYNITDAGVKHLSKVHTVNLSGCNNITDAGVKHLSKAHTVNLSGCSNITDKISNYLSKVNKVSLWYCSRITQEGMKKIPGVETIGVKTLITNGGMCSRRLE